ncbi:hypothetical protein [Spirillospora sp. CA-294931]|uniref:hypothetical protein n=1 Tax=Spirillospora sp. CA-294931 TaxID=3240042 RepID=UPI003D8E8A9D
MRIRGRVAGGLLAVMTGAVLVPVVATGVRAEVCQHRTGVSHDGGLFGKRFTEDAVCGNRSGAPLYARASTGSGRSAVLETTESWFLCWTRGERHAGGNDVWYYTQGDRVVGDPSRRGFGFVPASELNTENDPGDSRLAQCPPIPTAMTASFMTYDRRTGAVTASRERERYRSASLVKILIALDYLYTGGGNVPPADLALLQPMLRASDDAAASTLWSRGGSTRIVERMVARIGLRDTAPPERPGMWGYTAISAADTVSVYRYLLEKADPRYRDFIMGNLHQAQECAADGWNQFFGIPRAVPRPWAVKQGWSGFHNIPPGGSCAPSTGRTAELDGIDLTSGALHSSGTVCEGDRKIIVVLTLHPVGVPSTDAAARLTALTKEVHAASPC